MQPPAQVAADASDYFVYCSRCHGVGAISSGVTPGLRHSGLLANDGWFTVVLGGAMKDGGMASFAPVLSEDHVPPSALTSSSRPRKDNPPRRPHRRNLA